MAARPLNLPPMLSVRDWRMRRRINSVCVGYSRRAHWKFFKTVLSDPRVTRVCVLGVYKGRDLGYMGAILRDLARTDVRLVGVDKFEDRYCDDWPEALRGLTWQQAGFGEPPDLEEARGNLRRLGLDAGVHLQRDVAEHFLSTTGESFDFIYIDTAHDYASTVALIELALARLEPGGLVGGDDFSDEGTWGVARAVKDSFEKFQVFSSWIWLARGSDFKRARAAAASTAATTA
jgi:methyltransferase family protein